MPITKLVRIVGTKGVLLQLYKQMKRVPRAVTVPIFGTIRTWQEIENLSDNFAKGELRDRAVEDYLGRQHRPCIIDCGVNVGITVRWWFHINTTARVYGVDMLKEALEFTQNALKGLAQGSQVRYSYRPISCPLYSEDGTPFRINIDDPLIGTNSLFNDRPSSQQRELISRTLDTIMDAEEITSVDLLKIDLEGAGGYALQGAGKLLGVTKYVIVEIHNEDECKRVSVELSRSGFVLRRFTRRNLWWDKADQTIQT